MMLLRLGRIGAAALALGGLSGTVLAQQVIYSCELSDGTTVLETEQVSNKCHKVSETVAPPKPPAAVVAPAAPAVPAAASAAKAPAVPVAKPANTAATAAAPAKASSEIVVKAPPAPVKVPPKRTAAETYHDVQVKKAENALHTDDPEHGIVGAAPTSNSSRRYLMTDREHYQKAIGASAQGAPAPAQK